MNAVYIKVRRYADNNPVSVTNLRICLLKFEKAACLKRYFGSSKDKISVISGNLRA
jgi:hypothetical protein